MLWNFRSDAYDVFMTDKEPIEREPTIEDYEQFRSLTVAQRHAYYLQHRGLETPSLIGAFSEVERGDFISFEQYEGIFLEKGIGIGHDQVNSWPTIVVKMLEKLQPEPGDSILDVGSGSGWTTALMSHVVGKDGKIVGVERIQELAALGNKNIRKYRHTTNAEIHHTPTGIGLPDGAPYDKILVSAEIASVPEELAAQLAEGGVILIPIKNTQEYAREYIAKIIREAEEESGKKLSEEVKKEALESMLKDPGSNAILFKKVDGKLEQVDVIDGLTFVPLIIED